MSTVSLKRVENHTVYIQHRSFLEAITQKYPHKDAIVIKRLFHGSRESSIAPIYNQGFNRNFAADANGMLSIHLDIIFNILYYVIGRAKRAPHWVFNRDFA